MESFDVILKSLGPEFAIVGVILTILYKIYRMLKVDNRQDSFHSDEQDFRKILLDELEKLRKEREDLLRASIPIEKHLVMLETSCTSLYSYCKKCVEILKTKSFSCDPEIGFLIRKGEELIASYNSTKLDG